MSRRATFVYFVQSGDRGDIKIGLTADMESRLAELQCGNPVRLHVVGVVTGDWALEQSLHARFAEGRIHGEWFKRYTPGLPELLAHVFDHGSLPPVFYVEGDPMQRGCSECRWPMEPELAERGETRCWRCITHPLEPNVPSSEKVDGA